MDKIKEKIDNETKTVKSIYETMENAIKGQIDKGLDKTNTHELYEAFDMLKDASEIKLNCAKTMYYTQIMEAMEDSEYGVDYDENGEIRYYQPRSKTSGRFMSRGDGRRNYRMTPEMYREYEPEYYRIAGLHTSDRRYREQRYRSRGLYQSAPSGRNGEERSDRQSGRDQNAAHHYDSADDDPWTSYHGARDRNGIGYDSADGCCYDRWTGVRDFHDPLCRSVYL
jgi:hypothetical protein